MQSFQAYSQWKPLPVPLWLRFVPVLPLDCLIRAGLGISILAELVLRRTNYNIVMLPAEPSITRTLAIGYKDKSSLPIASKYFIDFLLANVERLP